MKPGTIIRLPDGREATVVYHGLDGYGIRWGRIAVDVDEILAMCPLFGDSPESREYEPEAMLREPCSSTTTHLPCVGSEYEMVEQEEKADAE